MPALINLSMPAELGWSISPTETAADWNWQQRYLKKMVEAVSLRIHSIISGRVFCDEAIHNFVD